MKTSPRIEPRTAARSLTVERPLGELVAAAAADEDEAELTSDEVLVGILLVLTSRVEILSSSFVMPNISVVFSQEFFLASKITIGFTLSAGLITTISPSKATEIPSIVNFGASLLS